MSPGTHCAYQTGGSHEIGLRAGTPNVAYIVGMPGFRLAQTEFVSASNLSTCATESLKFS